MIACEGSSEPQVIKFFSNQDAIGFYGWDDCPAEQGLERLVFQVSRNATCLEAHLERIYYCFQNNLNEQLFGALIDLLIVLGQKGQALGRRMVAGARTKLTESQFRTLADFYENKQAGIPNLNGHRYSVFAKGILSQAKLLEISEGDNVKVHDPLDIARDYIEFSQVEAAIKVLEDAVMEFSGREDIHQELLALYRSTRNMDGFYRMYEALSGMDFSLPPGWKQLDDFFIEMSKHEK